MRFMHRFQCIIGVLIIHLLRIFCFLSVISFSQHLIFVVMRQIFCFYVDVAAVIIITNQLLLITDYFEVTSGMHLMIIRQVLCC